MARADRPASRPRSPRRAARRSSAGSCAATATRRPVSWRPQRAGRDAGHVRRRDAGRRAQRGRRCRQERGPRCVPRARSASSRRATRLVVVDASQSGAKAPAPKRLADAIAAAGGSGPAVPLAARAARSPAGSRREARERGLDPRTGRGQGARRAGRRLRPARATPSAATRRRIAVDGARQARALPRLRADPDRRRPGARRRGGPGLGLGVHRRRRRAPGRARPSAPRAAARDHARAGPARGPPPADPRAARDRATASRPASGCRRSARRWASQPIPDGEAARPGASCGRRPSWPPRSTACSSSMRWSRARRARRSTEAQRRLAFSLWVIDHAGRDRRRSA